MRWIVHMDIEVKSDDGVGENEIASQLRESLMKEGERPGIW